MSTVGLCVITKELDHDLLEKLDAISTYVDAIYVQVNGKQNITIDTKFIQQSSYKWNDNFADARNALLAEVKTDYWLWMDSDDLVVGADNIRKVVDHMEATGVELMYAPYLYQVNADGVPTEVQNRERIIKTATRGAWVGAIHETFIPEGTCVTEHTELVRWAHQKTAAEEQASTVRNEAILRSEWEREHDPRIAYYLGLNLAIQGKYDEAIHYFGILISEGGWDEERYRAHLQIASCHQQSGRMTEAVAGYLQATTELPDWPDAYMGLQQVYYELDDHAKSVAWYEIGRTKQRPETDSAYNPIVVDYQPRLIGALSYLFTGQPTKALQLGRELKTMAPGYAELAKLEPEILRAYNEEQAIKTAQDLIRFNEKYDGDALAVLTSLPTALRADIRLTEERRRLIPGKTWDKGSVVFYCGQGYEPWGPDTLARGMGGSEEAIVYLSRALALDGQLVTVYNERSEPMVDGAITYKPWTEINPNDTFDTFVAWRDPTILKDITATTRLCDLHDIIDPKLVYAAEPYCDRFMFKSEYQRRLYPHLPDNKCAVIGNGISKEHFNA